MSLRTKGNVAMILVDESNMHNMHFFVIPKQAPGNPTFAREIHSHMYLLGP